MCAICQRNTGGLRTRIEDNLSDAVAGRDSIHQADAISRGSFRYKYRSLCGIGPGKEKRVDQTTGDFEAAAILKRVTTDAAALF